MLAAEQGNLEIVQELVRRGANVNLDDVVSKSNTQSVLRLFSFTAWKHAAVINVFLLIRL